MVVKAAQETALTPARPAVPTPSLRLRQRFAVPFEYDVVFTWDALEPSNAALLEAVTAREPARRHRVLAFVDDGLVRAWPELPGWLARYAAAHDDHLTLVAPPRLVPGGEAAKNDPALIGELHAFLHRHAMDRHSFVLVIGGGSVQDAAGLAAATAHRGVRTVRMPTTVLSQADSGVGVKNGVNAFGVKNFVGTFAPPHAVLADFRFLERLPARDRAAGLAEAVKVALIRDVAFFEWLETHGPALSAGEPEPLAAAIHRSAALHLEHIAQGGDPFERGSARPLDYGHWAAHKLESLSSHDLRHGEAVALGLLLDSRYSQEVGLLPEADFDRIRRLLDQLGLPAWDDRLEARGPDGRRLLFAGLDEFREHLGGELTITLLRRIGAPVDCHEVDEAALERALSWMRARAAP